MPIQTASHWETIANLIASLAWPTVALLALILLRRPLLAIIPDIASRAKKLSVYNLSVELSPLPELSPSWSVGSEDVRQLTSAQIFDSAAQSLFDQLLAPRKSDIAVVDLGKGHEWLTSRLYIFALVLGEYSGIRAFVFLETSADTRRRFIGTATPAALKNALAAKYPWIEEAYAQALAQYYPTLPKDLPQTSNYSNQPPLFSGAEQWRITNFIQTFVEALQRHTEPPENEKDSYLEFQNPNSASTWERAHWIDGARLENDFQQILNKSHTIDSPDTPRSEIAQSILNRQGDYVALVDADRRFTSLIDRRHLLETAQQNQS